MKYTSGEALQKTGSLHCGEKVRMRGVLTFVKGTHYLDINGDVRLILSDLQKFAAEELIGEKVNVVGVLKCPPVQPSKPVLDNIIDVSQGHVGWSLFSVEVSSISKQRG